MVHQACLYCLLLGLLASSNFAYAAQERCSGPYAEVKVFGSLNSTLYAGLAPFGAAPPSNETTSPRQLQLSVPADACTKLRAVSPGAVVLVERGNCSFLDKAWAVQQAGASAMLVYDNEPGCISMGYDPNNATQLEDLTIHCASITHSAGQSLLAALSQPAYSQLPGQQQEQQSVVMVTLQTLELSPLDGSALLLFVMAVGTVVAGSLWSGSDHMQAKRGKSGRQGSASQTQSAASVDEAEVLDITPKQAAMFVVMASLMLLLLFFFLNKFAYYVLLGLFCLASTNSLAVAGAALLDQLRPKQASLTTTLPLLGEGPTHLLLAYLPALLLCGVWVVCREQAWAWVLQDVLGLALMLLVLRSMRISSLKVACILLPLCFLYDIFWVFISPLLFHGTSVMVEVARGGSSGEALPMLLMVPRFQHHQLGGYSMLGFGDVILPGLLVAYCRRLDLDTHCTQLLRGYFFPTAVAYAVGLLTTFAALYFSWFGNQGQPALLYLVPCTLGTVLLLAVARGQLGALMAGPAAGSISGVGGSSGERGGGLGGSRGAGLGGEGMDDDHETVGLLDQTSSSLAGVRGSLDVPGNDGLGSIGRDVEVGLGEREGLLGRQASSGSSSSSSGPLRRQGMRSS